MQRREAIARLGLKFNRTPVEVKATTKVRVRARTVLGWPKRCKLARVFLWDYSYKGLELAQLLGRLGVSLTQGDSARSQIAESGDGLEKIKGGEPVWGKLYSGGILCARYG